LGAVERTECRFQESVGNIQLAGSAMEQRGKLRLIRWRRKKGQRYCTAMLLVLSLWQLFNVGNQRRSWRHCSLDKPIPLIARRNCISTSEALSPGQAAVKATCSWSILTAYGSRYILTIMHSINQLLHRTTRYG